MWPTSCRSAATTSGSGTPASRANQPACSWCSIIVTSSPRYAMPSLDSNNASMASIASIASMLGRVVTGSALQHGERRRQSVEIGVTTLEMTLPRPVAERGTGMQDARVVEHDAIPGRQADVQPQLRAVQHLGEAPHRAVHQTDLIR